MPLRRRWWFRLIVGLLVSACLALVYGFWDRHGAQNELRTEIAKLDGAEVGWRLDDIQKNRRAIADDVNGALVVNSVARKLPKDWRTNVDEDLEATPPHLKLHPEVAVRLRDEIKPVADAVDASRDMLKYPHGRFPIEFTPDFISTPIPDHPNARIVVRLLEFDAYRAIDDKQFDRALESIRAQFNVGHCFDDEPLLISQLIRIALQSVATSCLERTLAQGIAADDGLATMQRTLTDEAAAELFFVGMRGERAGLHGSMTNIASSDAPVSVAMQGLSGRRPTATWWDHLLDLRLRAIAFRSDAWLLRENTRVLAAAKLPGSARYKALKEIDREIHEAFQTDGSSLILARLLVPAVLKMAEAEQRTDTRLNCAAVAVAAERFRLKNMRWPKDLEELVADKFLDAVPEDLYVGGPLRLRRAADGIVIYSAGKDGDYQGDGLDRLDDYDPNKARPEFRLWDPEHRAGPPLPPRKRVDVEPEE